MHPAYINTLKLVRLEGQPFYIFSGDEEAAEEEEDEEEEEEAEEEEGEEKEEEGKEEEHNMTSTA